MREAASLRKQALVAGDIPHYRAADGGDAFEALRADLAEVVLPAVAKDETRFRKVLAAEVSRRMAR